MFKSQVYGTAVTQKENSKRKIHKLYKITKIINTNYSFSLLEQFLRSKICFRLYIVQKTNEGGRVLEHVKEKCKLANEEKCNILALLKKV